MVKKTVFLFLLFLLVVPNTALASTLIIKDKNISETVIIQQFSLSPLDDYFINMETLELLTNRIGEQVYIEPINAKLDDHGYIIPEKPGLKLDRKKFTEQFLKRFYRNESAVITIPKKEIFPRVDGELLTEISTNEIGSYMTYYKETNKERSHNISLATKAIDNHVVFPGEEFSFNKVVGKRTVQKGYKRAPVIVRGELSEDIGGGICQVSSTLFNAVNLEGIEIIERYSHSRHVPYVPPGKDATVSWWGPDFVFKNTYQRPILIRARSGNGQMIVKVYSSDDLK